MLALDWKTNSKQKGIGGKISKHQYYKLFQSILNPNITVIVYTILYLRLSILKYSLLKEKRQLSKKLVMGKSFNSSVEFKQYKIFWYAWPHEHECYYKIYLPLKVGLSKGSFFQHLFIRSTSSFKPSAFIRLMSSQGGLSPIGTFSATRP